MAADIRSAITQEEADALGRAGLTPTRHPVHDENDPNAVWWSFDLQGMFSMLHYLGQPYEMTAEWREGRSDEVFVHTSIITTDWADETRDYFHIAEVSAYDPEDALAAALADTLMYYEESTGATPTLPHKRE